MTVAYFTQWKANKLPALKTLLMSGGGPMSRNELAASLQHIAEKNGLVITVDGKRVKPRKAKGKR